MKRRLIALIGFLLYTLLVSGTMRAQSGPPPAGEAVWHIVHPGETLEQIAAVADGVEGVRATEKLRVRKVGMEYFVDLHVQADETMPLREAHNLSGKVKGAIRLAVPGVSGVLIHMEPYNGVSPAREVSPPRLRSPARNGTTWTVERL